MKNKKLIKPDEEWKKILTPEQFNILRKKATEQAGCSRLNLTKKKGKYYCVACDNLLFDSKDKFESGTGWPSFTKPATDTSVEYRKEKGFLGFGERKEVICWRCEGHLGHVFDDGPKPTGKRFCINGKVLRFVEEKK